MEPAAALFPTRKSLYDAQLATQALPLSDSTDRTTPEGVGRRGGGRTDGAG